MTPAVCALGAGVERAAQLICHPPGEAEQERVRSEHFQVRPARGQWTEEGISWRLW